MCECIVCGGEAWSLFDRDGGLDGAFPVCSHRCRRLFVRDPGFFVPIDVELGTAG